MQLSPILVHGTVATGDPNAGSKQANHRPADAVCCRSGLEIGNDRGCSMYGGALERIRVRVRTQRSSSSSSSPLRLTKRTRVESCEQAAEDLCGPWFINDE